MQLTLRTLVLFCLLIAVSTCLETDPANGQLRWKAQVFPSIGTLKSVSFVDATIGWVAGDSGLFCTTNAGVSWTPCGPKENYPNVQFLDRNVGYLWGMFKPGLLKTIDAGLTWSMLQRPSAISIQFVTADTGFCCSYNSVFRTYNGGVTWSASPIGFSYPCKVVRLTSTHLLVFGRGTGDPGFMEQSYDGGVTWDSTFNPQTKRDFFDAFAIDPMTVYAVLDDYDSACTKSTDGGKTWKRNQPFPSDTHFPNAIWFTSKDSGFVIGDRGYLGATNDGGVSWVAEPLEDSTVNLLAIQMLSPTNGYAVGTHGTVLHASLPDGVIASRGGSGSQIRTTVSPLPSSGKVTLRYALEHSGSVSLSIYEVSGREIAKPISSKQLSSGWYELTQDFGGIAAGSYLYRMTVGDQSTEGKILIER